jgi:putative transposase
MSEAKVQPEDYIDFLIASPKHVTATEAAKVQPDYPDPAAHDAFTRLLHRLEPDPETIWLEAETQVSRTTGILVIDDATLDKPYSRAIDLVTRHWSGKHHAVVQGINLVTLLWTDGDRAIPCDYRIYDKSDELSKNDHFVAMLTTARARGFQPRCVVFDGWYSSLSNLKLVNSFTWRWLTRLKSNRLVNKNHEGLTAVSQTAIEASGTEVWLKGYGLVKVFKIVAPNGDVAYWATNDRTMTELERLEFSEMSWQIEHYHRGVKQCTEVERCQCRAAKAQRNHIELALRAFLRLESHCFRVGVSWFEAKKNLIRDAIRAYLNFPTIRLIPKPTA